ncbi:MAG TPA: Hsp20/alpha crystallin family protein [Vicinamibacterales bacterium]|nr:Hsp20/alpha crystallin family protein [Vicinamibacterales bacterium]
MPFDPFQELRTWQERLGRLSSPHPEPWSPAIDVYETPDRYVVVAEVPGLSRDQVVLALETSRLTIRGRRIDRTVASDQAVHFHQIERGHGAFSRTFEFADKIDVERVSADLSNGVLSVTLPKMPPSPARRIEVRINDRQTP